MVVSKYPSETIIAFDNVKEAALYFDNVIDFQLSQPLEQWSDGAPHGIGWKLAPPKFKEDKDFRVNLAQVNLMMHAVKQIKDRKHRAAFLKELTFLSKKERNKIELFTVAYFLDFLKTYNLFDIPIHALSGSVTADEKSEDISLTLLNANVIDTANCPWEKILEFRKDAEAHHKLRRLRLFAYENYVGKPESFVKEDILKRLEDAKEVAKRWEFETKTDAISILLTSKILAGGVAGSFFSVLAGAPLPALLSITGGVAIESGRIGIHLAKRRFAMRNLLKDNPILYFNYAESKLKTP